MINIIHASFDGSIYIDHICLLKKGNYSCVWHEQLNFYEHSHILYMQEIGKKKNTASIALIHPLKWRVTHYYVCY